MSAELDVPGGLGFPGFDGAEPVEVRVREDQDGRGVVIVPRSVERLGAEPFAVVEALQRASIELARLREEIDGMVADARDLGVSWSAIGWSVGMTPQAARQRWLSDPEEDL